MKENSSSKKELVSIITNPEQVNALVDAFENGKVLQFELVIEENGSIIKIFTG